METKNFVVQTFTRDSRQSIEWFDSLEYARNFSKANGCSLIYRREQVACIDNGFLYLKLEDCKPID
jgi:hypothetical protein